MTDYDNEKYTLLEWISTSEQLPPKGEWVLVTTDNWQKPCEIMCYQGVRVIENECDKGYDRYFPSWTSGHGDIQSKHPTHWMKLPDTPKEMQFFCP